MNRYVQSCLVLKPKESQKISSQRGLIGLINLSKSRPKIKAKRQQVKRKKGKVISEFVEAAKEFYEALSKMSPQEQIAQFGRILTEDAAVEAKGAEEQQARKVRGGRERGTPNDQTKLEILDPYDELRTGGLDDIRAQTKVAASLVPKLKPTLGDYKKARRRVAKAIARHRSDGRVHLE